MAGKASLKLGHWVALGAGAAGDVLLLLQMLFTLLSKYVGAGLKVLAVVEALILIALLTGAVLVLLMTLKNPRLRVLAYSMAAAAFFLEQTVASLAMVAGAAALPFFIQTAVLAFVAGALMAGGAMAVPTGKELHEAAGELHRAAAAPPTPPMGTPAPPAPPGPQAPQV
jgi:hypothetical protein